MAKNNVEVLLKAVKKIELQKTEIPKPKKEQILVKTIKTLISTGTELTAVTGDYPKGSYWDDYIQYPFKLGYSNIGEIIEIGSEVSLFKKGDIVASFLPHLKYGLINEKDVVKVPKTISFEEASFFVIAAGVMNSVRLTNICLGNTVVVFGLGLLGQFACLFSRLVGGFPVICVDISDKRLNIAKKYCNATFVLNPKNKNIEEEIKKINKGELSDIVFEVTGNPKLIVEELKLVKKQGKFIVLSSPRGKSEIDFHDLVNARSIHIIGTHFQSAPQIGTQYNPWTFLKNAELFFELLESKIIQIKGFITHRYSWKEIESAYELLIKDRTQALGVILDWKE